MSIQHQLCNAAACCLSTLQRYHDAERTAAAKARMAAEVELLIGYLLELDLSPGMAEAGVLKPVGTQLVTRYGHEVGRRLDAEFMKVFEGAGMPMIYNGSRFLVERVIS